MELYIGLATTAGIFIGILTALLISRLTNLKEEKSRLEKRIKTLNVKIESLNSREKKYGEDLILIEGKWEKEKIQNAKDDVEDFINSYVGKEIIEPVENLTEQRLHTLFSAYMELDINEYHEKELEKRRDEIEIELAKKLSEGFIEDNYGSNEKISIEKVKSEFKKEYQISDLDEKTSTQLEKQINKRKKPLIGGLEIPNIFDQSVLYPSIRSISNGALISKTEIDLYEKQHYDTLRMKLTKIITERQSLERERENLKNKYDSIDPNEIRVYLHRIMLSICLSVIVPFLILFLKSIPISLELPSYINFSLLLFLEPIIVFVSWLLGLSIVFFYIKKDISELSND